MRSLLRYETPALTIALVSALLLALGSGDWLLGLAPFPFLLWWLYLRLLRLERWIEGGMKASQQPHDEGLVGEILRQLQRRERAQGKRQKRINRLLRRINSQIAALPDATLILGPKLEIEWSNAPAGQLLGIRYPADRGQPLGNLLRNEKLMRYLRHPQGRKPVEFPSPVDPQLQLRFRAVPFGKGQRLLIARNISEQKQVEQALKQFVAHASHELKTPLTTIRGYLEMIGDEPQLSPMGRQAVEVATAQAERMETLIHDLLQLSRLDSRKLDPDQGEELDPVALTRDLVEHLPDAALRQRISIDADQKPRLRGLRLEIESILQNLLDNALNYTGGKVCIRWQVETEGEILLEVCDQGPGIDADELKAIRQHYYRGRETTAKQIPGTGLGLAIVEQAARLHGAQLEVESDPQRGSCFRVRFPAWRNLQQKQKPQKILRL